MASSVQTSPERTVRIRVTGTVQGVGFRPMVWRLAQAQSLAGRVCNDGDAVLIDVHGASEKIALFILQLREQAPPLSRVESVDVEEVSATTTYSLFEIVESNLGLSRSRATADAAVCPQCAAEIRDPEQRRHGYPFTNCTNCGPRFSIMNSIPYDRVNTTMVEFTMCAACHEEYKAPQDRRFHAQPIACPNCGPSVWFEALSEDGSGVSRKDDAKGSIQQCVDALRDEKIVAIRGLGGFHLSCDAASDSAVRELRARKRRYAKPLALMSDSLEQVRRYCYVGEPEEQLLTSPEAPIVLLERRADGGYLSDSVSPGSDLLGFMLAYTPLHLLICQAFGGPLVMTSGNLSDEPQVTGNQSARGRLRGIADFALMHDREIANRIDDSVVRVIGDAPRLLRRARGYAPTVVPLPRGFDKPISITAFGGELKSTFCLVKDGTAVVSQHQGDLEDASTFDDFERNLGLYARLFSHEPDYVVADRHPEYLSTKLARAISADRSIPIVEVQHHHAHIASCLLENGVESNCEKVLGVALDGLGYGDDDTIWGGEFLLADYKSFQRLGTMRPTPMIGGTMAIKEPWRSTYAHIVSAIGWAAFEEKFGDTSLHQYLIGKPLKQMDVMLETNLNVPLASSCGRLFDAVSAAIGLCPDRVSYEGQGAIELEMLAARFSEAGREGAGPYPFAISWDAVAKIHLMDAGPMWASLCEDLREKTDKAVIASRFHDGLIAAIHSMVLRILASVGPEDAFQTVALSGGCFQNRLLLEGVSRSLTRSGLECLTQSAYPSNDGGLSLGQAAVAAARLT